MINRALRRGRKTYGLTGNRDKKSRGKEWGGGVIESRSEMERGRSEGARERRCSRWWKWGSLFAPFSVERIIKIASVRGDLLFSFFLFQIHFIAVRNIEVLSVSTVLRSF